MRALPIEKAPSLTFRVGIDRLCVALMLASGGKTIRFPRVTSARATFAHRAVAYVT